MLGGKSIVIKRLILKVSSRFAKLITVYTMGSRNL